VPDDPDDWEGDDEGDELPVIPADGEPAAESPRRRRRQPRAPKPRKGSPQRTETHRADVAQATGRSRPAPPNWRDDLGSGDRGAASRSLGSRGHTHNSDSGYGLA
jgi:hypothetical protein